MSSRSERTPLLRDAHFESKRSEKRGAFLSQYVVKGGVGAELGVFWGHFSEVIIREFQPRTLFLVDLWDMQGDSFDIEGAFSDFGRLRTADCYAHVKGIAAAHPGVVTVIKDDAAKFLTSYRGEPFDWVYIDTSHLYEPTLRELTLIAERLKPGGVILGDDWIADLSHPHYEVVQAVHAFVRATEFEIVEAGRGHQFVLRRGVRARPAPRPAVPAAKPEPRSAGLLQQRLRRLSSHAPFALEVVSGSASVGLASSLGVSLASALAPGGAAVSWRDLAGARPASSADVMLLVGHVHREESQYLAALRDSGYDGVIAAWLWDNHHAKDRNRQVAELSDLALAAHDHHAGYLAGLVPLLPTVMVGSVQWTGEEARAFWGSIDPAAPRSRDLYGGFARYKGSERTAHIEQLIATGRYPAVWFVDGARDSGYIQLLRDVERGAVSPLGRPCSVAVPAVSE